jgi:hypothetical protein
MKANEKEEAEASYREFLCELAQDVLDNPEDYYGTLGEDDVSLEQDRYDDLPF